MSAIRRALITLALIVATGGCGAFQSDEPFVINQACYGTWAHIRDGEGRVLADRLTFGQTRNVLLEGYRGQNLYLVAVFYNIDTNVQVGTLETSRSIPRYYGGGGSMSGPSSQVQPWVTDYINSPWNCRPPSNR